MFGSFGNRRPAAETPPSAATATAGVPAAARGGGRFARRAPAPEPPANASVPMPAATGGLVPVEPPEAAAADPGVDADSAEYIALKVRLHQKLLEVMNLSAIDKMQPEQFRLEIGELVRDQLNAERVMVNQQERAQLVDDILDEILGLGPIEPLLKDPSVSDILVNTSKSVYVERRGRLERTTVTFKDDRHLLRIINKIVSAIGRRIDESSPLVDARLADGSRVNAVCAPIAVDGPLLSIRKFSRTPIHLERMIEIGSLVPPMAALLKAVVEGRLNVIISGGTGSGKTTMLNAMSRFIGRTERIVTIEDAAELQLQQPHVARMETRPPNIEGKGEIAQRELLKNALRMRPDRIIVGECRGGEAFDMLQAMNTGHDGSMTTVHANTCRDAISRIEQMVGMAGFDLPLRTIRQQVASAIDVIVQVERMSDGKRRMVSLSEVVGMEGEIVTMQEIFRFKRESTDSDGTIHGHFWATGIRPTFLPDLEARGIQLDSRTFSPDMPLG
ncbi:Type II/IV secretion system ATP hydrolase TadA/VirB11/CpaF, TadA subfamily [Caenispirillum salinarum AK4]|uniref:Type II/IV secretion system ATP hydrolase TadA/VirB11/CpaF, TadA subfamily n=1 Tax=Caenispirillum salinarum AK4 TaxID=1238182 RepID=K9HDW6_9PROT|nr:CpaF family protein [Caenispirillum salinarum]EKV28663.1 Type II/IV secretion system ATP hydrolase TadA/VirB11/CpaF, TadA subfamily [Caenispirillum salinarum AK4]